MDERERREQREAGDVAPPLAGGRWATEDRAAGEVSPAGVAFTPQEGCRLVFLRWLYRTGRPTEWA